MNTLGWLLQWPIRALVLLLVAALPLGVEMANFGTALWAAVLIGLLGTLLIWPLKLVLGPAWAITSLGGLIAPVSFLFNWLITIVLFAIAVVLPLFLPWLDRARVRSIRYRGWIYKTALTIFVISFISLGWLGLQEATDAYVMAARVFSVLYFAFFLLMPFYTARDKTKPVPERVVYHD